MQRVTILSTVGTIGVICFFILIASSKECDVCYSPPVLALKVFISGLVVLVGSAYFSRLYARTEQKIHSIETLPLLETDEATEGVPFSCEAMIAAEGTNLLKSPYMGEACVYYHSITEEYKQRGKRSEWVVIENLVNFVPFFLQDERGKLKVDITNMDSDFSGYGIDQVNRSVPDPDHSEIDGTMLLQRAASQGTKKWLGIIPATARLRRTEYVLKPGTKVFAHGYVSQREGELLLHEAADHPLLISKKTKDAYIEEFYQGKHIVFFVHLLFALGFSMLLVGGNYALELPGQLFWSILTIGNVGIAGSVIFTMYNRLMSLKERAAGALSNIDVELKRRADLLPQIITVIQGHAKHEQELQRLVANLRVTVAFQPTAIESKPNQSQALLAIVEKYPAVKASENYQHLMTTLVDTEERIAYSRVFYNRNVRKLNVLRTQFPFILLSWFLGIRPMKYLTLQSSVENN